MYASGSSKASVQWTESSSASDAIHLGFGLHEVDFEPRRDGLENIQTGNIDLTMSIDGRKYIRTVRVIRPRMKPSLTDSMESNGVAVAISSDTDEIIIIRRNGSIIQRSVLDGPSDAVFIDRKASIALSHRYSPQIWILESRRADRLKQIRAYGPQSKLTVSPDRKYLAAVIVGNSPGIQIYKLSDLSSSVFINLDKAPTWLEFGQNSDVLLSSWSDTPRIEQIRRSGSTWKRNTLSLTLERPPYHISLSKDRSMLSVLVSGHEEDTNVSSNHRIEAQELQIRVRDLRVLNRLPTFNSELVDTNERAHGASPRAVGYGAKSKRAITFAGTHEFWVIETSSLSAPRVNAIETPDAFPESIAYLGSKVWAVAHPSSGTINLITESGRTLKNHELESDANLHDKDPNALRIRTGEKYFKETTRKGVSCQSCHENLDSDYSTHDIGTGEKKPTLSVRGIAFTAPFLRSGSYPNIESLEHVVLEILGGYEKQRQNRGAEIQYFLESLTRRQSHKTLSLEQKRIGLSAFVKAGCDSCHQFPAFTNLEQISATYLFPERYDSFRWLDTPSLLSVGSSPPYLADGRAKSLASVIIDHNPKNRHGNTSTLSEAEKRALIDFLEAL